LADPEGGLISLNPTMAADRAFHLFVAHLAAFIVKNSSISYLGFNN